MAIRVQSLLCTFLLHITGTTLLCRANIAYLQAGARQRASEAVFDNSRLVEFTEQIQYDAPAVQQTPLVQEGGRLVVTDRRLYFQPLHNVAGGNPVRSHPLAAVAAIAHRNSSLRPIGMLHICCFI